MHLTRLTQLHQQLLAADHQYQQHRTQKGHQHINHCQQRYYAALSRMLRTKYPPHTAAVRRAKLLCDRARANRARQKDDPVWQDIALHQYRRAQHTRMRAMYQEEATTQLPTQRYKYDQNEPVRVRIKHPITGRYTYTTKTRAQLAQEKKNRKYGLTTN